MTLVAGGCLTSPDEAAGAEGSGALGLGTLSAAITAEATTRPVTLRTAVAGKYVAAESGGGGDVHADRDVANAWETFTLYDLNGGSLQDGEMVSLQTLNGNFVCAEDGGGSVVDAMCTDALDWETFRVVKLTGTGSAINDGDQIALQTKVDGLYVSAEGGGGAGVVADRPQASGWEAFVVGSPWRLTWSDEFDGTGAVDGSKWGFDVGAGGWGNNELEYYTERPDNVRLDGNGQLEIVARAESFNGAGFTSGRINTACRFAQRYGRFEARIKLPSGNGIWPAFWTLGDDIATAPWPSSGELNIMEAARNFSINHGSAHGPGYSGSNPLTATYQLPSGSLSDDFHVFAIEWELNQVRWYIDGAMYARRTPADLPSGARWVFDHPFFLLLNIAVGGDFAGAPDGSTLFPQTMLVDYVRIYTR